MKSPFETYGVDILLHWLENVLCLDPLVVEAFLHYNEVGGHNGKIDFEETSQVCSLIEGFRVPFSEIPLYINKEDELTNKVFQFRLEQGY